MDESPMIETDLKVRLCIFVSAFFPQTVVYVFCFLAYLLRLFFLGGRRDGERRLWKGVVATRWGGNDTRASLEGAVARRGGSRGRREGARVACWLLGVSDAEAGVGWVEELS